MPIPVVCAACQTKLVAPDAAAGKKVKCKNCHAVIPVPELEESDFEFVDAPPKPAAAKPVAAKPVVAVAVPVKPKPVVVAQGGYHDEFAFDAPAKKAKSKVVVEDDDEPKPKKKSKAAIALDGDDAPAPSQKKKKAVELDEDEADDTPRKGKTGKKTNPLMFVGLGAVALIAVGFIGVMVWYFAIRGDKVATAETKTKPTEVIVEPVVPSPGPVLPAGWKKYEKPEFDIALPESLGVPDYQHITGKKEMVFFYVELPDKSTSAGVVVFKLTAEENRTALADPEKAFDAFEKETKTSFSERKSVVLDGHTGREVKGEDQDGKGSLRFYLAHGCRYMFSVQAKNWADADAMATVFYENIKLKAADKFGSGASPVVVQPYPKGWTKYEQPEFTANFADVLGEPKRTTKKRGQSSLQEFIATKLSAAQSVTVEELAPGEFLAMQQGFAKMSASIEKGLNTNGSKVSASKDMKVDGIPARSIAYQTNDGSAIMVLVLANNRFYTIIVNEPGITEESPIYRDFIANLKLKSPPVIPPKPTEPVPEPAIPEDPEVAAHFKKKGWVMTTSTATTGGIQLPKLDVCDPKNPYTDIDLTDEDYKMIGKAKGVKVLIVQKTKCTDAALKLIAANQTIVSIWIEGDAITDAGLRALTEAKSLTYINIRGNDRMTDAGIGELAKLPKLETLHLVFMRTLNGSCFEKFIGAKELRDLFFEGSGLTNACAPHIAKLTQVKKLSLLASGSDLSSAGIKTIVKGHLPYSFVFHDKLLDDELLALLVAKGWLYGPTPPGEKYPQPANASGVSRLKFKYSPMTDKGFAVLLDCVNITELDLAQTGITDATLLKMGGFKELKNVWFEKCKITGKGLLAIASAPIEFLDVRECPLEEDAFKAFGKMPALRELYVTGSKAKAPWVQHLIGSKTMKHYFAAGTEFDDASALQLSKIATLTVVTVPGATLTDKGFAELLKLPKLESLTLDGTETKVTKEAYLKAKKDHPNKRFYCGPLEKTN